MVSIKRLDNYASRMMLGVEDVATGIGIRDPSGLNYPDYVFFNDAERVRELTLVGRTSSPEETAEYLALEDGYAV